MHPLATGNHLQDTIFGSYAWAYLWTYTVTCNSVRLNFRKTPCISMVLPIAPNCYELS